MKIQIISDIHSEGAVDTYGLAKEYIPNDGSDVLVLAGDITVWGTGWKSDPLFQWCSENFEHTIYIPGNHEYYAGYPYLTKEPTNESIRDNVYVLNNQYMDIEGVRFIGSTLWSKILPDYFYIVLNGMIDYKRIKEDFNDYKGLLRIPTVNRINELSIEYIFNNLSNELKNVVVTHHTPSYICTPEEFKGHPSNCAFNNNLDNRISDSNIDYWIYGHTHGNIEDIDVNGTWLTCNQLGYSGERHGFTKKNIYL